jgi:uncharacterized protein (DUF2147 family)
LREKLCGRLVWLNQPLDGSGRPGADLRNAKPELRTRQLCGLSVLGDLRPTGPSEWGGGWIYSPQKGKTYGASLRLDSDRVLKLRIGTALLGETVTWTRADPKLATCPPTG